MHTELDFIRNATRVWINNKKRRLAHITFTTLITPTPFCSRLVKYQTDFLCIYVFVFIFYHLCFFFFIISLFSIHRYSAPSRPYCSSCCLSWSLRSATSGCGWSWTIGPDASRARRRRTRDGKKWNAKGKVGPTGTVKSLLFVNILRYTDWSIRTNIVIHKTQTKTRPDARR